MEFRQLQHFVAVAEEQHFTRAARRVNIVQSALSASIRLLEEDLGTRLFVRSSRQVLLTAAGRVLYEKAKDALQSVKDARDAVSAVQGLKRGTLAIGTVQSLPAFLDLSSLLARFHAHHPGIDIHLFQDSSAHLLEKLRSGSLNLAFMPLCEPPEDITNTMIACEALVVACARDHALAGRENVALADLAKEPFVDFAPEWGTRRLVDLAFMPSGVERRIAFEVSDLSTLLELVERDLGIALVPEAIARRHELIAIAHLLEPEICWELVVAYPAATAKDEAADPVAKAFLDLLASSNPLLAAEAPAQPAAQRKSGRRKRTRRS